jgi:hypothetical protein
VNGERVRWSALAARAVAQAVAAGTLAASASAADVDAADALMAVLTNGESDALIDAARRGLLQLVLP